MVKPQFIDTHAHLYADEFKEDISQIINNAQENGITQVFLPNIDEASIAGLKDLVTRWPNYFVPMMGLHPCSVTENYKALLAIILAELNSADYYKAVGEIGIDLYWDKSTLPYQQDAFIIQCQWAVERNLPVAIHARDSTSVLIDILQKMENKPMGVFHCFGGTLEEAQQIIAMDMYLGIGGVLTFKNSNLKEILPLVPIERLVLETDAPYLAPAPFRGKRNESSYILHIAAYLSGVLNRSVEEIGEITSENARKLFRI
jgi:TatD DNase family protein